MPRLTKQEKEIKQMKEELAKLKEEKILNFIYDTFKQSDFKDRRILKHIIKQTEGSFKFKYEIICFVYETPKEGKKYENDDYLILFRHTDNDRWRIINFDGIEIGNNFTTEMFYEIVYGVYEKVDKAV